MISKYVNYSLPRICAAFLRIGWTFTVVHYIWNIIPFRISVFQGLTNPYAHTYITLSQSDNVNKCAYREKPPLPFDARTCFNACAEVCEYNSHIIKLTDVVYSRNTYDRLWSLWRLVGYAHRRRAAHIKDTERSEPRIQKHQPLLLKRTTTCASIFECGICAIGAHRWSSAQRALIHNKTYNQ